MSRRRKRQKASDKNLDAEMINNLEMLLNYDAVEFSEDWDLMMEFDEEGVLSEDVDLEDGNA